MSKSQNILRENTGARTLVITGGSKGIGESTIACFQKEGWEIINISRTACALPDVKNFNIDLNSIDEVKKQTRALEESIAQASTVCLVHNAVLYQPDAIPSLLLDDLQQTLQINVVAPVLLNQIFIPYMPPGSSIIYLGSTLSEKAVPGSASYVISKHAIIGLMRATTQDLINNGIRSACVCPGLVDTGLLFNTMDEQTLTYLLANKVIGKRLIEPDEIAKVIYFCATNPVLNGAIIHANLGQVAD